MSESWLIVVPSGPEQMRGRSGVKKLKHKNGKPKKRPPRP